LPWRLKLDLRQIGLHPAAWSASSRRERFWSWVETLANPIIAISASFVGAEIGIREGRVINLRGLVIGERARFSYRHPADVLAQTTDRRRAPP
jgi:hypothetical protein